MALMPLAVLMGALPATDAFTASDGTDLTTYSANWALNNGGTGSLKFSINTNAVHPNTSGNEIAAHWTADAFANDHYAKGTISNIANASYVGLAVRAASGSTYTFYDYNGDGADGSYMSKYVSGSYTALGSAGAVFTTSLAIELHVSGTTITPKRGGSTADIGAQTDSSIASGSAGISGYGTATGSRLDNWEGGNIGSAAASVLWNDRATRFQNLIVR